MLSYEQEQRILLDRDEIAKECAELCRMHRIGKPVLASAKDALVKVRTMSSVIFEKAEHLLDCHGEVKDFDDVFVEMLSYATLMDKIIDGLVVVGQIMQEEESHD